MTEHSAIAELREIASQHVSDEQALVSDTYDLARSLARVPAETRETLIDFFLSTIEESLSDRDQYLLALAIYKSGQNRMATVITNLVGEH